MKITVIWEDQLGVLVKGFGPHVLLVSCVADALRVGGEDRFELRRRIDRLLQSIPKKGNGNVLRAAKDEVGHLLRHGPVFVVVDRDQIHTLCPSPTNCMSGFAQSFRGKAPGNYDLVFLDKNVETLFVQSRTLCNGPSHEGKPNINLRDQELGKLASDVYDSQRAHLLQRVPSFNRLVDRVATAVKRTWGIAT